jgi:Tol biopolymer transport system component
VRCVALAAVAAALAAATHSAARSATAEPKWIVFAAKNDANTIVPQLYRIKTDGTGLEQITTGAQPAGQPSFAPDGTRIAFVRLGAGIYTANVDGSDLKKVTSGTRDAFPTWSPNGKQIAFIRVVKADWRLNVMSSSGGAARRLPLAPSAGRPSWTPDGKAIFMPTGGALAKVDARTGKIRQRYPVKLDIAVSQGLAVSPDGKEFAYIQTRPPTGGPDCGESHCPAYGLYLTKASAPRFRRRVAPSTGNPGWSPDSKEVIYVGTGTLTIDVAASGQKRRLSPGTRVPQADAPAWQPR